MFCLCDRIPEKLEETKKGEVSPLPWCDFTGESQGLVIIFSPCISGLPVGGKARPLCTEAGAAANREGIAPWGCSSLGETPFGSVLYQQLHFTPPHSDLL